MITVSSNLATKLLIERLGVDNIRRGVHALGADGMKVLRGVEDSQAFQQGLNNTTTARALALLIMTESPRGFPPARAWRTRRARSPGLSTTRRSFTHRGRSCW
jgi:beta-lactamase class A